MALITASYLRKAIQATSGYYTESLQRDFAQAALSTEKRGISATAQFDIFLSHAFEDAILIKALRDELSTRGYSVYVDWIDDPQMDRSQVTKATAQALRGRMWQCRSLLFATSTASRKSVWMPWELGYIDRGTSSRVAIAPIVPDNEANAEFRGQEYLGLYPYLDLTGTTLWVHETSTKYVSFREWLSGKNP